MAYVPEYPEAVLGGGGARIFDDGMYGFDEVCKWPGFLSEADRHLSCIPAPALWRRYYRYNRFHSFLSSLDLDKVDCLWDNITPSDFTNSLVKITHTDPNRYGTITRRILGRIVKATEYIDSLRLTVVPKLPITDEERKHLVFRVEQLHLRICDVLSCLKSFHDNWIPTLFRYRELQRCNLEILGHLILFSEVMQYAKSHNNIPPSFTFPVLGAMVSSPEDLLICFRGGIPCWKLIETPDFVPDLLKQVRSDTHLPIGAFLSLNSFKDPKGKDIVLYRDHRYNRHSEFGPKRDMMASSGLKVTLLPTPEFGPVIIGDKPQFREDIISAVLDKNTSDRFLHMPFPFVLTTTSSSSSLSRARDHSASSGQGRTRSLRFDSVSKSSGIDFRKALGDLKVYKRADVVPNFWSSVEEVSRMDSPYSESVGGVFTFPTPSLFADTSRESRGQRSVVWLSMRLIWIHSAFTSIGYEVKPISTDTWRMLTSGKRPFVEIRERRHRAKFDKRQAACICAQQIREKFGLGDYHPGLTGDWGDTTCTASTITGAMQAEIIYELHHMNFLSDFLSLDNFETKSFKKKNSNFNWESRKNTFLSIFNHETILDPEEVRFPDIWSLSMGDRLNALTPWFGLMMEWPSCPPSLITQGISSLNEQQFGKYEREMIGTYVLLFSRTFCRYPVVPIIRPSSLEVRYERWLAAQVIGEK